MLKLPSALDWLSVVAASMSESRPNCAKVAAATSRDPKPVSSWRITRPRATWTAVDARIPLLVVAAPGYSKSLSLLYA